jgi:hypothetical protein
VARGRSRFGPLVGDLAALDAKDLKHPFTEDRSPLDP